LILALEKFHENGVILLGLTPSHILLDSEGFPRIVGITDCYINGDEVSDIIKSDLFTEFLAPEILLR
jgi:hypothetical protein